MLAISELWGINEADLDSLIRKSGDSGISSPMRNVPTDQRLPMAGDRMLAGACRTATWGIELSAPAEVAWSWLTQLMRGGGMYGWPALETQDCHSATHLIKCVPAPRVGGQVHRALILASLEPGREIVWVAAEPLRILKHEIAGLTIDYLLEPLGPEFARLTARLRFTAPAMTEASTARIAEALELLFIRSQLTRLREYILESRRTGDGARTNGTRHQHAEFKPAPGRAAM
jgi:hypothetical protein